MNADQIRKLSDADVLDGLTVRVKTERKAMTEVLEFLREVDRRRLYAELGCASLWEFCVKKYGYSSGAASRRVQAVKLLGELPELKEDLESGRQNLSSLCQAQKFFQVEEKHQEMKMTALKKREVLEKIRGKSTRESERELIGLSSAPIEISRPEKKRVLDETHIELRLVLDSGLLEKLNRIRALRSHSSPSLGYKELLGFMADAVLKKLEPKERSKAQPTVTPAPALKNGRRVAIPAAVKREVKKPGKCGFINEKTGESCDSRYFLEIDHVIPVALGGSNNIENLRLRCRAHNQRASVKIFGARRGMR